MRGRAPSLRCPAVSASRKRRPLSGVSCEGRPEISSAKWDVHLLTVQARAQARSRARVSVRSGLVHRCGGSHVSGRWLRALDWKGSCARGICIPIGPLGPLSSSIHWCRPVPPLLLRSSAEAESGEPIGDHSFLSRAGAVREGEAGTIDGSSAGAEAAFPPCTSTMERPATRARDFLSPAVW